VTATGAEMSKIKIVKSKKEKQLLRLFEDLRERFYVIGIYESGAKDTTHGQGRRDKPGDDARMV
jgi:hypothetical protein